MDWIESSEAIGAVDDLLAAVGLDHGSRKTLRGTWEGGSRLRRRQPAPSAGGKLEVVRVPAWDGYPWLRHGFSTRAGGVSTIYGAHSLNLGWTKDDDAASVAENRRRFLKQTASVSTSMALVGLRQFHSGMVRVVEAADAALDGGLTTSDGRPVLRGDAAMTDVPGVMLAVGVADCVPVLVADVRRRAVAVFHAGWRGTLGRIVQRGIGTMRLRYGSRPADLVAAIGPSIGPCCYSVGEEIRFDFESQFAYSPDLFTEVYDSDPVRDKYPLLFLTARAPGHSNIGPQLHLNLWEANRRQLLDSGLQAAKIWVRAECTACKRKGAGLKYFSHRGESGFTGRMLGVVGIAPKD